VAELKSFLPLNIINAYRAEGGEAVLVEFSNLKLILVYRQNSNFSYIGTSKASPHDLADFSPILKNCIIKDIQQVANDRIIEISLMKQDRLGRAIEFKLIAELIPKRGNFYLVDSENQIKAMLIKKELVKYAIPHAMKSATVLDFPSEAQNFENIAIKDFPEKYMGLNDYDFRNLTTLSDNSG